MKEDIEIYENAKKRVFQKKVLFFHFIFCSLGAITFLILDQLLEINVWNITNWSFWASGVWYLFVLLHAINILIYKKFMGDEWERRQIERLSRKQANRIAELKQKFEREAQFTAEKEYNESLNKLETPKKMQLILIAAKGQNNELGKDNDLIWHLPADLKRFKSVTSGHHIIMGRNTYESIGKPLPNRTTVIITRNKEYSAEGCVVVHSLEEAIRVSNDTKAFIIGGAQIYQTAINLVDQLDITEVHENFEADAFFPDIDTSIWKESTRENCYADDKNKYHYSFVSYIKK